MVILHFKQGPQESAVCKGVKASAEQMLSAEQQDHRELQLQQPSNPTKVTHLKTPFQKK